MGEDKRNKKDQSFYNLEKRLIELCENQEKYQKKIGIEKGILKESFLRDFLIGGVFTTSLFLILSNLGNTLLIGEILFLISLVLIFQSPIRAIIKQSKNKKLGITYLEFYFKEYLKDLKYTIEIMLNYAFKYVSSLKRDDLITVMIGFDRAITFFSKIIPERDFLMQSYPQFFDTKKMKKLKLSELELLRDNLNEIIEPTGEMLELYK